MCTGRSGCTGGAFPPAQHPGDVSFVLAARWQSCRGGGLALAACRLSRARHPPRPPTPLLLGLWLRLGASGEVLCSTPRSAAGSSACAWEPLRGKGPVGTARCWHRHPMCTELCAQMWTPCTPSGVPQQSPPLSPMPGCGAPAESIPLPSGTASPLSPCPSCPRGCCPRDSGCQTPSRSPTKTLLSGTEQGSAGLGGAGLGRVPPNTNQEGGAAGSVRGETPPQLGKGGSGRGKRGPAAAPGNKESVWLVTALRKRGETNAPLIGGEVTAQETLPGGRPGAAAAPGHCPRDSHPCHARPSPTCLWDPPPAAAAWDTCPVRPHPCFGCTAWI